MTYKSYIGECVDIFLTLEYVRHDGLGVHALTDELLWSYWAECPVSCTFEEFCVDVRQETTDRFL